MSGLCGILRYDGASPSGLGAMTDLLERRGPEGTRHQEQNLVSGNSRGMIDRG
jgi:hypothetical protein